MTHSCLDEQNCLFRQRLDTFVPCPSPHSITSASSCTFETMSRASRARRVCRAFTCLSSIVFRRTGGVRRRSYCAVDRAAGEACRSARRAEIGSEAYSTDGADELPRLPFEEPAARRHGRRSRATSRALGGGRTRAPTIGAAVRRNLSSLVGGSFPSRLTGSSAIASSRHPHA